MFTEGRKEVRKDGWWIGWTKWKIRWSNPLPIILMCLFCIFMTTHGFISIIIYYDPQTHSHISPTIKAYKSCFLNIFPSQFPPLVMLISSWTCLLLFARNPFLRIQNLQKNINFSWLSDLYKHANNAWSCFLFTLTWLSSFLWSFSLHE